MPTLISTKDALIVITTTIVEQGEFTEAEAATAAQGILAGLIIGYGMDATAFLASHSNRLAHLTRQGLKALGLNVTPTPGEMPRNM